MNCHYCNKVCSTVSYRCFCYSCQTIYDAATVRIFCEIHNQEYFVEFRNGHYEFPTRIGKGNFNGYIRDYLINIPHRKTDITPTNIKEKISLYLTFL